MVEKVDGAGMDCKACGAELVCHMSKYEGGFENKLQWQNSDGTAHYKWKSPGKFDCVLPEENNETSEKPSPKPTKETTSEIPKINSLVKKGRLG